MAADQILTLQVGPVEHKGWKSVSVESSIEQAVSSFSIAVTESWEDEPGVTYPGMVYPGDSCEILIDDDVILTGWIDAPEIGHSADDHTITATGKSKTCDLVACSCRPPYQFKKRTLGQIATALCGPYGITVEDLTGNTDLIKRFSPETGESPFAAIEKLARDAQALVTDTPAGLLQLTRAGTSRGPGFTHPGNILRASILTDISGRFSEYRVKGQTVGDDENYGSVSAHPYADAEDSEDVVGRYRLKVIKGERQMNPAACKRRAIWEAVTRAGKSIAVRVTVWGWRDADGDLYQKNRIYPVTDPVLGVDADLLAVRVNYTFDRNGKFTHLTLAPPGAYETIEPVTRAFRIEKGIRLAEKT